MSQSYNFTVTYKNNKATTYGEYHSCNYDMVTVDNAPYFNPVAKFKELCDEVGNKQIKKLEINLSKSGSVSELYSSINCTIDNKLIKCKLPSNIRDMIRTYFSYTTNK